MGDAKDRNNGEIPRQHNNLVTGARRPFFREGGDFIAFEAYIISRLREPGSALSTALKILNEDARINFIKAILLADKSLAIATLHACGAVDLIKRRTDFADNTVPFIFKLFFDEPGKLGVATTALIRNALEIYNFNTPDIDWITTIWIERVLKQIPNEVISPEQKLKICASIDPRLVDLVSNYAYQLDLPTKEDAFPIILTDAQYKACMNFADNSDFVILSIELLKSDPNFQANLNMDPLKTEMADLRKNYFNYNYVACEVALLNMAQTYAPQKLKLIEEAGKKAKAVDPEHSLSTRVSETKAAQFGLANNSPENFNAMLSSVQKISDFFAMDVKVSNVEELMDTISTLTETSEDAGDIADELKGYSSEFNSKRTQFKAWATKDPKDKLKILDNLYTAHQGLLPQKAPFIDMEPTPHNQRQRPVDKYSPDQNNPYYGPEPYVKGISGHAYAIVGIAALYLYKGPGGPANKANRELEVESFLKAAILMYVIRGYHSFQEMYKVFQEPRVAKLFSPGILERIGLKEETLEKAMTDSGSFTRGNCLGKALASEINQRSEALVKMDAVIQQLESKQASTPRPATASEPEVAKKNGLLNELEAKTADKKSTLDAQAETRSKFKK